MLSMDFQTLGNYEVSVEQEVPPSIVAIFGPSGAGKSTLLRAIAGFEATHGHISLDGDMWLDSKSGINLHPIDRPIGYVRQAPTLFPHLSVRNNLKAPIRFGRNQPERVTIDEVINGFDLLDLLEKRPSQLSGGETQRVAIARSLLTQPKLLLLDEPLTGLDLQRKAEILPYLEGLHSSYHIPTLFVSHAIDELMSLCQHTLVLVEGKVKTSGPTQNVLERRELNDVLEEPGEASSLIPATVIRHDLDFQLTQLRVANTQEWSIPLHVGLEPQSSTTLRIRARDVALATIKPVGISVRNLLEGTLVEVINRENSAAVDCVVQADSHTRLRAQITRASLEEIGFETGDKVFALVKAVTLH